MFISYPIITIGGATEDIIFYTDDGVNINNRQDLLRQHLLAFEAGAKIKINRSWPSFGGGAANAAVNFTGLGLKTATLICLGRDNRGDQVLKNLKGQGVATKFLSYSPSLETGFSFVLIDHRSKERIIFSARGANNDLKISPAAFKYLRRAKWLYITSLSGNWLTNLKTIFKAKAALVAWNPGEIQIKAGARRLRPFLSKTEFLFLNKDEAIELALSLPKFKTLTTTHKFFEETANLLRIIKGLGPKRVVITDGRRGAYYYDGGEIYFQAAVKEKKKIDVTGVGDAFNSSIIAGLEIYHGDIKAAMKLGARNAARKIAHLGAQNGLIKLKKIKSMI
ncbi:MAG: PfkB family carbohydrate kinase [Candidatus Falkowbacteria bacterium]|nr:PfkB family carbohydrate kinase [Candidatus Falkowbacteria bacterium]